MEINPWGVLLALAGLFVLLLIISLSLSFGLYCAGVIKSKKAVILWGMVMTLVTGIITLFYFLRPSSDAVIIAP